MIVIYYNWVSTRWRSVSVFVLYLFVVLRTSISLSFCLLVCGAAVEKFTRSTKLSLVSSEYVFLFQLRSSSGIRCPTFPDQYTVSNGVQQSHNGPYAIRTETSTVRCESQKTFCFIYLNHEQIFLWNSKCWDLEKRRNVSCKRVGVIPREECTTKGGVFSNVFTRCVCRIQNISLCCTFTQGHPTETRLCELATVPTSGDTLFVMIFLWKLEQG